MRLKFSGLYFLHEGLLWLKLKKKIWSVSRGTIRWFDMEWPLHKNSLIKLYNLRKRKIHTASLTLFTCAFWHMRVENLLEEPAKLRKIHWKDLVSNKIIYTPFLKRTSLYYQSFLFYGKDMNPLFCAIWKSQISLHFIKGGAVCTDFSSTFSEQAKK